MNHFFYESRSKEKVRELMQEGIRSQAQHRSRMPGSSLLRRYSRWMVIALGLLGLLTLFLR